MAENQNPVFTDNTSIGGDGTEENPLFTAGSGTISEITSDDGSITVSNPNGPITDLSVNASQTEFNFDLIGSNRLLNPGEQTALGSTQSKIIPAAPSGMEWHAWITVTVLMEDLDANSTGFDCLVELEPSTTLAEWTDVVSPPATGAWQITKTYHAVVNLGPDEINPAQFNLLYTMTGTTDSTQAHNVSMSVRVYAQTQPE